MGTRKIFIKLKKPFTATVGDKTFTEKKYLFSSTAETKFPEEEHICNYFSNSELAQSAPIEITIDEVADVKIPIKWSRAYIINMDFHVVKQPPGNTCWAAALTILLSYRDQKSYTTDNLMQTLDDGNKGGEFSTIFNTHSVIYWDHMQYIVNKFGLVPIIVTKLSASFIYKRLRKCGPLLVFVLKGQVVGHFLVIYGIDDLGGDDKCKIQYLDVWSGQAEQSNLTDLITWYYKIDSWENQMWYFPGMENKGTVTLDGVGKNQAMVSQNYVNRMMTPMGPIEHTAQETISRMIELEITITVKPGKTEPSPEDVIIALKMSQFIKMSDKEYWETTMTLVDNDTVLNPDD